jgi:hypothetical protein
MANLINEDDLAYKLAAEQILNYKNDSTYNAPIVNQDDADYSQINVNQLAGSDQVVYTSALENYAPTSALIDYAYASSLADYAYTSALSNYVLSGSDLSSLSGVLSLSSGGTGNTTFSDGSIIIVSGTNFVSLEKPIKAAALIYDGTNYGWVLADSGSPGNLYWDGTGSFSWA